MTAPVSIAPTVTVLVDGVRLNDGCMDPDPDAATVLTDLRVTWGRPTSVDQPAPATATFTLLNPGPTHAYLDLVGLGRRLDINADAVIYPDPTVSIVTDPRWAAVPDGTPIPAVLTNARAVASAGTGATVTPVNAATGVRVILPPAPFTPGDPTGWDAIPRTRDGQTWRVGLDVNRPIHLGTDAAAVTVRPVYFTGPDPSYGTPQVVGPVAPVTGTPAAGWTRYATNVVPPAGRWLGVAVDIYPTGPAWEQVAASVTWASLGATPTWEQLATAYLDNVVVLAPAAGAGRAACVFSGRITDLVAGYDEGLGATVLDVTAADQMAELASRPAGATPWAVTSLGNRFAQVVAASGQPIAYTLDTSVTGLQVSWRDVDNQPAARLLTELALSADAVLWSATHLVTGPVLSLAAVGSRLAMSTLAMGPDLLVHVVIRTNLDPAKVVTVSACDVLLEPVRWRQDNQDVATRVAVTWRDQTVDSEGLPAPTDRTVTSVASALEVQLGAHRVSVGSELITSAAATALADALLGRLSTARSWRVDGLTWDLEPSEPLDASTLDRVMRLLDGTTRLGQPIRLTDLPAWSPLPENTTEVPLYVEGGVYTHIDGAWRLQLTTSSAIGQGKSLAWQDMPATWEWNEMGPEVSWSDLAGVGKP